jgi:hypothetical protein
VLFDEERGPEAEQRVAVGAPLCQAAWP